MNIEEQAKKWAEDYPKLKDYEYTNSDIIAMLENTYMQAASDMYNNACKEFKKFLDIRIKAPNYTITETDIKWWIEDFKAMLEK